MTTAPQFAAFGAGRLVHVTSDYGDLHLRADAGADGPELRLIDPEGRQVGTARLTFRVPPTPPAPSPVPNVTPAAQTPEGGGCVPCGQGRSAPRPDPKREAYERWHLDVYGTPPPPAEAP